MSKIMIIEDDIYLREELVSTFVSEGHMVCAISSFIAPEIEILDSNPDLVLLDINLPNKSGFEICKYLKSRASFPILILTGRDALSDELYALGLGADDFLTKPCHKERLIARAKRLIHTYGKVRSIIQAESISLDIDINKVFFGDCHIILSETEGNILRILIEHYPRFVSKQQLFSAIWGGNQFVDENILQVNITRLRKSLDIIGLRNIIQTLRGQGYYLEVNIG